MIPNLIRGIAKQLHDRFGDGFTIYQDKIPQGLREPCFFLLLIAASVNPYPNGRTVGEYSLDIHYFPKNRGKRAELFEMSEQLMGLLGCVTLLDQTKTRSLNLHSEIADDVLHVFAEYQISWMKPNPEETMDEVQVTATTEKGEVYGS